MKNVNSLILVFFFGMFSALAQTKTCDCKTDLDFVVEKIKAMPSYKDQIKGEKLTEFNERYQALAFDSIGDFANTASDLSNTSTSFNPFLNNVLPLHTISQIPSAKPIFGAISTEPLII